MTQVPAKATRTVIDVSGDGSDNCNPLEPTKAVRDELVGYNVTINGLPILEGKEAGTLEGWYKENVMGGGGAFVLPAEGFGDFGRAIRQKFVVEVSGNSPGPSRRSQDDTRSAKAHVIGTRRDPSHRRLQPTYATKDLEVLHAR